MTEHPIIFSTAMVQAILEGRKSQTRRICQVNDDHLIGMQYVQKSPAWPENWKGKKAEDYTGWIAVFDNLPIAMPRVCPYGKVGDTLWVRESFQVVPPNLIFYKADNNNTVKNGWKPSIHMPRTSARIFLKVENIRVERVQEITELDAKDEGVDKGISWMHTQKDEVIDSSHVFHDQAEYRIGFKVLWEMINGKRAPWETKPWVWVITFSRIENYKSS